MLDGIVADNSAVADCQPILAASIDKIAGCFVKEKRWREAHGLIEQSLQIVERLLAQDPANRTLLEDVIENRRMLAELSARLQNPEEASP